MSKPDCPDECGGRLKAGEKGLTCWKCGAKPVDQSVSVEVAPGVHVTKGEFSNGMPYTSIFNEKCIHFKEKEPK